MATIFFASEWIKRNVRTPDGCQWHDTIHTGYGTLRASVVEWAGLRGHDLVVSPDDADFELHVGDVGVKPDPHIYPSAILTMFEQSAIPADFCNHLPRWDRILLPSAWCVEVFGQQLREAGEVDAARRLRLLPLGIKPERFPYTPRPTDRPWTVIAQGVEIRDRKGLTLLHDMMHRPDLYPLPDDLRIVLKVLPVGPSGIIVEGYDIAAGRMRLVGQMLDPDEFRELLQECDHSVNPTAGEGFGLIPLEHACTGMGVSVTHWSGVMDYVRPDLFRQIEHDIGVGSIPMATVAYPRVESIYENIMWGYENRDEVRAMGRESGDFVRANWTIQNMYTALDGIVDELGGIERRVNENRIPVRYDLLGEVTLHEGGEITRN